MANLFTLPALGASLFLAVVGGVQLGESTVGMINPIHYQGPALHPRDRGAAIDEARLRSPQPGYSSLYGWDEGHKARRVDCGNCEALSARDSFVEPYEPEVRVHRATIDEWDQAAISNSRAEGIGGPDKAQTGDLHSELKERIVRYAHYEIEAADEPESDHSFEVEPSDIE